MRGRSRRSAKRVGAGAGVLFVVAAFACGRHVSWAYVQEPPELAMGVRVGSSVLKSASAAGLPDLAAVRLPEGDVEARVWLVPSSGEPLGAIVRKEGRTFHALAVDHDAREVTPSRPWGELWTKLLAEGLLTLPDESALPRDRLVADGSAYVVETNVGGKYRAYAYSDPYDQEQPEATSMLRIAHTLSRALGVELDDSSQYVPWGVPDDQVVLVRRGADVGAFVMHDQSLELGRGRFDWSWWSGGAVTHGSGVVERQRGSKAWIRFGPFAIEWEAQGETMTVQADGGRVQCCGVGRLYFDASARPFALARTNAPDLAAVNPSDPRWVFQRARVEYDDR